jgi:hypothetical protein
MSYCFGEPSWLAVCQNLSEELSCSQMSVTSLGNAGVEIGKKLCAGEVEAQWGYARYCTTISMEK